MTPVLLDFSTSYILYLNGHIGGILKNIRAGLVNRVTDLPGTNRLWGHNLLMGHREPTLSSDHVQYPILWPPQVFREKRNVIMLSEQEHDLP